MKIGASFILGITTLSAFAAPPALEIAPLNNAVILAWDPSLSPGVVEYKIYMGFATGIYDPLTTTSETNTTALTDLPDAPEYFFVATSVDALGGESPFSNEATYIMPAPDLSIGPLVLGVTVHGIPGSTITLMSAPDINGPWAIAQTQVLPASGSLLFGFVNTGGNQFFKLM